MCILLVRSVLRQSEGPQCTPSHTPHCSPAHHSPYHALQHHLYHQDDPNGPQPPTTAPPAQPIMSSPGLPTVQPQWAAVMATASRHRTQPGATTLPDSGVDQLRIHKESIQAPASCSSKSGCIQYMPAATPPQIRPQQGHNKAASPPITCTTCSVQVHARQSSQARTASSPGKAWLKPPG